VLYFFENKKHFSKKETHKTPKHFCKKISILPQKLQKNSSFTPVFEHKKTQKCDFGGFLL